jgi:hypothetical protein
MDVAPVVDAVAAELALGIQPALPPLPGDADRDGGEQEDYGDGGHTQTIASVL